MTCLSRHQASKATAPQLTTRSLLPPGIQADEIERHRTADLLQVHHWLATRAGLPGVQVPYLLRKARFHATAHPILAAIDGIALRWRPLKMISDCQQDTTST